MAQAAGVSVSVGDRCDELKLTAVTRQMAAALNAYLGVGTEDIDAILRKIKTPGSSDFPVPEKVQAVFFSGGVVHSIYHESADTWAYGDIGVLLGRAILGKVVYLRIFKKWSQERPFVPRLWVPGHIQRRFQEVPLLIPMIFFH